MNKIILIGNVGKDPETRNANGKSVANFSVATSEKYKKDGNIVENTQWHNVVFFGDIVDNVISKYVKKGGKVAVVGKVQYEKYTDQSGVEKTSTKIIGESIELLGGQPQGTQQTTTNPQPQAQAEPQSEDIDDLPF